MLRLALALTTLLWGASAQALCQGQDLRDTLSVAEQAELSDRLAQTPYPEGNLWRATRGDEVITLIGTIHLGDPRLAAPLERLRPVIGAAKVVLLEMDAEGEARLKRALGSDPDMLLISGTTLPELMPEEDWQALAEAIEARGIPRFMAARFQPWYLSMLLALPPCLAPQMQEANGLDKQIIGAAEAAGVPTAALEDFTTIFEAFNSEPIETQIDMLSASLMAPKATEDLLTTVIETYFDERPAESWILSEILSRRFSPMTRDQSDAVFAGMQEALLDRRNRAWIPVILSATGQGPVVAAFGAAHLPGETGVLRLLEAEGFTLERLPF